MEKFVYAAEVNGKHFKKFERVAGGFMNSTWAKFNKYAISKGFDQEVVGAQFLGGLAWSNGSEIMELVQK